MCDNIIIKRGVYMVLPSRLRSFESDLYDILDYELPASHQIVSVKATGVGYDEVKVNIVIKIGNYAIPDEEYCQEIVEQYITNLRYDYKDFGDIHYGIQFR